VSAAPAPLRLRPLPLADLLDETFRTYRASFSLFVVLNLLLVLPGLLSNLISGQYRNVGRTINIFANLGNPSYFSQLRQQAQAQPDYGPLLVGYLVIALVLPFNLGTTAKATLDVSMGRPTSVGTVLRGVLARYWGMWGLAILLVGIAFTCLCPPVGLWLLVAMAVAVPALLEERVGPGGAIRRSWNLVRKNWWRVFGIVVVVYLLTVVVQSAIGSVFGAIAFLVPGLGEAARGAVVVVATSAVGVLVNPITPIVATLLYFDLRVRREAIDLDQLAYQAAMPPPPPPPGAPGS